MQCFRSFGLSENQDSKKEDSFDIGNEFAKIDIINHQLINQKVQEFMHLKGSILVNRSYENLIKPVDRED
jgi:hypothetical protein